MGIKDLTHSSRPREKALLRGIKSLDDEELLCLIFDFGTKNLGVKELSFNLLKKYGSLKNIVSLSSKELMSNNGIKIAKALKILTINEIYRRINLDNLLSLKSVDSQSIGKLAKTLISDSDSENLYMFLINKNQELIYYDLLNIGGKKSVTMFPQKILKLALEKGAYGIYLVHNHPSNNLYPSDKDRDETYNLEAILNIGGIRLIDHLIIGNDAFYSIKNRTIASLEK